MTVSGGLSRAEVYSSVIMFYVMLTNLQWPKMVCPSVVRIMWTG